MGKMPGNLLVDANIGALRHGSHLSAALKKRIVKVGSDLEVPGFVRAVLLALVHCCTNRETRVRVAEVQSWLGVHRQLWLSERTIKAAVSVLVGDLNIQIGSSRDSKRCQPGYFFITTPAQAEASIQPLIREAKSLLHRVRQLSPCRSYFRRMCGQLEVEL